jgi:hypothetical protein
MQVTTLLTINLAISLAILSIFVIAFSILIVLFRKQLQASHITSHEFDGISLAKTPAQTVKSSQSSSTAFVPISLNNPSKSGFLSRSFASRAALDKQIFSRGLKEIF